MTSDIERPRQRTVAELLAEHGNSAATSRRRRRRAPDAESAEPAETPEPIAAQRTSSPENTASFSAGDNDRREAYRAVSHPPRSEPQRAQRQVPGTAPQAPARREFPTDVMPRINEAPAGPDSRSERQRAARSDDIDSRSERQRAARSDDIDSAITGPIPLVGPGSDTGPIASAGPAPSASATTTDGGPPTQFSAGVVDDDPDSADEWADDGWSDEEWVEDEDGEEPIRRPASADDAEYEGDTRYGDDTEHAEDERDDEPGAALSVPEQRRAATKGVAAWPAVIAQWIAGAVGGAALWVGFRYLWKSYPVVAVAAALVVTVGLVVIVRALLRNKDIRTTAFAVLVGLLLTASPAILVLIGR